MNFVRRLLPLLLLVLLTGCALTSAPPHRPQQAERMPPQQVGQYSAHTIDLTQPPSDVWDRIRRGFAIPNLETELTQEWTNYYAAHTESLQRMTERAGKYLYYILDEINRRGLPTELALLPFIESAYDPTALSRSQASGLWQFIPTTGQHFNLKQDWWLDERRDPIASTHAALDYLARLFEMQGDWYLALASYNWGEGAVQRAIAKNAAAGLATNYLSLELPEETRNYVPKLQAIKNIIAHPQQYGVVLPPLENAPYFVVTTQPERDIDLVLAAHLAEMPLDEFKALNPAFNRPLIRCKGRPTLLLPADRVQIFNANLSKYKGKLNSWKVYHARRGESYAAIARRFGVSETTLRHTNDIPARQKLASGQALLVPSTGRIQVAALTTDSHALKTVSPSTVQTARARPRGLNKTSSSLRIHKIRPGDTLFSLARQYRTSVTALRAANHILNNQLQVGGLLRIPPPKRGG